MFQDITQGPGRLEVTAGTYTLEILIMLLVAFLLGLLLGYLLWYRYRKMYAELEAENARLRAKLTDLEKEYAALKYKKDEVEKDYASLNKTRRGLDADIAILRGKLDKLEASSSGGGSNIDPHDYRKLQAENVMLRGKIKALEAKLAADMGQLQSRGLDASVMGAAIPLAAALTSDDLKKIEGIGPKIEGLLNDGGIHTFSALSNAKFEDLKRILNDAGPRYQMHNPSTWPKQAELAAAGKWDELQEYQDFLDGGKTPH